MYPFSNADATALALANQLRQAQGSFSGGETGPPPFVSQFPPPSQAANTLHDVTETLKQQLALATAAEYTNTLAHLRAHGGGGGGCGGGGGWQDRRGPRGFPGSPPTGPTRHSVFPPEAGGGALPWGVPDTLPTARAPRAGLHADSDLPWGIPADDYGPGVTARCPPPSMAGGLQQGGSPMTAMQSLMQQLAQQHGDGFPGKHRPDTFGGAHRGDWEGPWGRHHGGGGGDYGGGGDGGARGISPSRMLSMRLAHAQQAQQHLMQQQRRQNPGFRPGGRSAFGPPPTADRGVRSPPMPPMTGGVPYAQPLDMPRGVPLDGGGIAVAEGAADAAEAAPDPRPPLASPRAASAPEGGEGSIPPGPAEGSDQGPEQAPPLWMFPGTGEWSAAGDAAAPGVHKRRPGTMGEQLGYAEDEEAGEAALERERESVRDEATHVAVETLRDPSFPFRRRRTVYVQGLPGQVGYDPGDLLLFLSTFGGIRQFRIVGNPNEHTRFGFFEFTTERGANSCVDFLRRGPDSFHLFGARCQAMHSKQAINLPADLLTSDSWGPPTGICPGCALTTEQTEALIKYRAGQQTRARWRWKLGGRPKRVTSIPQDWMPLGQAKLNPGESCQVQRKPHTDRADPAETPARAPGAADDAAPAAASAEPPAGAAAAAAPPPPEGAPPGGSAARARGIPDMSNYHDAAWRACYALLVPGD